MEVKITQNTENALLHRKEVHFVVIGEAALKRDELKVELCKSINLNPEATIVVSIKQHFGSRKCTGVAHVYESKELLLKNESRYLLERHKIIEKAEKKTKAVKGKK